MRPFGHGTKEEKVILFGRFVSEESSKAARTSSTTWAGSPPVLSLRDSGKRRDGSKTPPTCGRGVPLTHGAEDASATDTEGRDAVSPILGIGCSRAVALGSLGKFRIRVCGLVWFPKDVVGPSPARVYCTGAPIHLSKPSSGSSSVGSKNEVRVASSLRGSRSPCRCSQQ